MQKLKLQNEKFQVDEIMQFKHTYDITHYPKTLKIIFEFSMISLIETL